MDSRKINICLQFWEGDRQRAMHLARFIADLEPKKSDRFSFTFVARFDCGHDDETVSYVAKKFDVYRLTGRRAMTGWPAGCNSLALDLFAQSAEKTRKKEWNFKAIYLIESDVMPLCRDWLARIETEWDKAAAAGKFVLGSWCPFHNGEFGHINGNMLCAPDICDRIPGLTGCPPRSGWDAYFAPKFAPHWRKSVIMQNHYDYRSAVPEEILWSKVDGVTEPAVAHGVKDFSAERLVRERLDL